MNVGMFSKSELARVVAETVPVDRTHAVVLTADADGAAVVVKMTLRNHWEVDAAYKRDWSGTQNAAARVVYSW